MSSIIPSLFSSKRQASCDEVQAGSHHALNTAYNDLKNRFRECEKKNRALSRKILDIQQQGINTSPPDVNMAMCGSGTQNGDLNLDASPSQTNLTVGGVSNICQSLESQNFQLQQSNRELSEKVIDLQERCQNIERANEELSVENIRFKEEIKSLGSSVRIRENEHVEKNHKLELENDSYLKKIVSLEKKLQFAEKQLQEYRVKTVRNDGHENIPQSSAESMANTDNDVDVSLLQSMCTKVFESRAQVKEFSELIGNQQTIIHQLIKREEDRSNVLSSQKGRVSISATSRSSSQQSFGARPKTPKSQQTRVWPRNTVTTAAMQCAEDMMKEELGLKRPYQHGVAENFKPSPAHSSLSANSRTKNDLYNQNATDQIDLLSSPIDTEMQDNHRALMNDNLSNYKRLDVSGGADRLQSWLGQLPAARNDSLEHLHDESPDEDYLADLENIDTAEDFDFDENVVKGASSRDNILPPGGSGAMTGSASLTALSRFSDSSPRFGASSNRSAGNRASAPASSGNYPVENVDPSLELENRYRPNSSYQLPRPLNIERNDGCAETMPKSYDNMTQNVNLLMSHETENTDASSGSRFAPNLFLNNDPLIGHKTIPNKNIYRDEVDKMSNNSSSNVKTAAAAPVDSCRMCPICRMDFANTLITMEEIQQHVLECCETPDELEGEIIPGHVISEDDRVCPVCSEQYPDSIPQADYESHVNSHFDEDDHATEPVVDSFGTLNMHE
ncbi:uncharacterized protein LOC141906728 [Tubulanus polymorphus]|uniref:uncharacterized protein LOC141906728 n=1 Tax=Tubulanus polymorphus TaxID=672921 RepID=UPI003DA6C26F